MLRYLISGRIDRALARRGEGAYVPALACALAFLCTATMSVPATAVIVPAVLVARRRAKAIVSAHRWAARSARHCSSRSSSPPPGAGGT